LTATQILLALALAFFTGWTIRRLWRRSVDPYTRIVYLFGVKGFGMAFFALSEIVRVRHESDAGSANVPNILLDLVTDLPLAMWGGYWWGRAMAWARGLEPSS